MRAVEDQSAPIPEEISIELGRIICNLARRPQSKASHTLAWLGDELGERKRLRARWGPNPGCLGRVDVQAWEGEGVARPCSFDARSEGQSGYSLLK
jgi:hypothetical protein